VYSLPARTGRLLAAILGTTLLLSAADNKREAPSYSAESVVNAASNTASLLAPGALATLYGTGLTGSKPQQLQAADLRGPELPTVLPGTGVRVFLGNIPAHPIYVSPTQINFLIPANLRPGPMNLWVAVDGQAGPVVKVALADTGPSLFIRTDPSPRAIVTGWPPDRGEASFDQPLHPGDIAILYATGLGQTTPPIDYGRIPTAAAELRNLADFDVLLDGARLERTNIRYAGVAPFFAGLYQVNIIVPDWIAEFPEIRLSVKGQTSPTGVRAPFRPNR
jgi:uncharacterized protein (TIGR03437 family)